MGNIQIDEEAQSEFKETAIIFKAFSLLQLLLKGFNILMFKDYTSLCL